MGSGRVGGGVCACMGGGGSVCACMGGVGVH